MGVVMKRINKTSCDHGRDLSAGIGSLDKMNIIECKSHNSVAGSPRGGLHGGCGWVGMIGHCSHTESWDAPSASEMQRLAARFLSSIKNNYEHADVPASDCAGATVV